jgi:hypothetical protein
MFKQVFLFLTLSITNSLSTNQKSKTALFISIPFIGHLNPLLHQAIELYHRHNIDYNIYIVSCSNIKTYVERNCLNTTIQFIDIGQCQNETELSLNLKILASETDSLSGISTLFKASIELYYPQMYEQMLNTIHPNIFNNQKTIIAIIDRITYAGADIADHFHIPYIINVAGLIPYLGWHYILPSDYNPTILRDPPQSIHSIGTNLLIRTIAPFIRYFSLIYMYFQYDRLYNYLRQTKFHFNNSYHVWSRYHSHLFLVNNAYGLEYAQHLPPNIQLTGPMISMKFSSNYYLTKLSDEDQKWIELDSRPIIYINFGTCVPISNEQIQKIFFALKSFDKYRVIWKLDRDDLISSTSTFRIVKWFSSTLGYLSHPNVYLFISHCGINSVYESIWLGTSVLCIPILADQQDMAQRLEDAGVGKWLNKLTFTSKQLKETIEIMLQENEISLRQRNIKRIQTLMKLHGGVERAVDLIEIVAEYGIESLIPINNSYPWYAYYDLDIYIIWLLILIGLQQFIVRCYCCCCCCYRCRRLPMVTLKKKTS